jgi:Uri superfamily endonuclease
MPKESRLRSGCGDCMGIEQARPGTYVLVLSSRSTDLIQIGRLSALRLQSGIYVYVGSALWPGGVRARLAHHLKLSRRPHWHIDYLRAHTRVEEICYCLDTRRLEHVWAKRIGLAEGASVPLVGFGSTDCRCESHLFFFERRPSRKRFRQVLGRVNTNAGPRRSGRS